MTLITEIERHNYYNQIVRNTFYQPIIQTNGLFQISNVKEEDVTSVLIKLKALPFIEYAVKIGGRYNFNNFKNGLPTKTYHINGKIKAYF